jgi:hypothetical protein
MSQEIYIYSMGKKLKITAIFDNEAEANANMAKTDNAVVGEFGKFIFLANKYDTGQPL